MGSGGTLSAGPHSRELVRLAIERANAGEPLPMAEPKPGHCRLFVKYTAEDYETVLVPLAGARLVDVTADDVSDAMIRGLRERVLVNERWGGDRALRERTLRTCERALGPLCTHTRHSARATLAALLNEGY